MRLDICAPVLFFLVTGCPAAKHEGVRVGVEASLREVGFVPFLAAAYGQATGEELEARFLDGPALAEAVERGELDEVLLVSDETVEQLEKEGFLRRREALAHEELVLIGPRRDHLGKYAESSGAELLRNVARTNHRFLEGRPGSVEATRLTRLFRATGDRARPGSWFSSPHEGRTLVRAAVASPHAFALVRRSSVLLESREGVIPERIWGEGDPALVLVIHAAEVAPAKAGRNLEFHAWLVEEGRKALATWGEASVGHALFAEGAPATGEGARFPSIGGTPAP